MRKARSRFDPGRQHYAWVGDVNPHDLPAYATTCRAVKVTLATPFLLDQEGKNPGRHPPTPGDWPGNLILPRESQCNALGVEGDKILIGNLFARARRPMITHSPLLDQRRPAN